MLIQRRLLWDIALTGVIVVALFVLLSTRSQTTSAIAKPLDIQNVQEVPPTAPTPKISLRLFPDQQEGWNMHVTVSNFRILPYEEASDSVASGFIYVSIDGGPRVRLYGPWHYVPALQDGKHAVDVSLHTDDFRVFARKSSPVIARFSVDVHGKEAAVQTPK